MNIMIWWAIGAVTWWTGLFVISRVMRRYCQRLIARCDERILALEAEQFLHSIDEFKPSVHYEGDELVAVLQNVTREQVKTLLNAQFVLPGEMELVVFKRVGTTVELRFAEIGRYA